MPTTRYPLNKIAEFSILGIALFLPSGYYFMTLPMLIVFAICRILQRDFPRTWADIRKPQILFPAALYLYIVVQFFFSRNFGEALSTLSTKLPLLLYPILIGTSGSISKDLIRRAEQVFLGSVCLSMLAALLYALFDVWHTHVNTVQLGEGVYSKFSSFGLTRLFYNWHPTYVAMFINHAFVIAIREYAGRLRKRQLSSFILPVFIFMLLSASLFLLNSIIGFIAFIAVLFYYGIVYLRWSNLDRTTSISILCLLLFCAFNFLYFNPFKIQKIENLKSRDLKVTDRYDERNILTIRLAKWETHMSIIRNHLVWGTTEGDIKEIREAEYKKKNFMDLALHNYNAHNEFIESLAMYGIAGFTLFMCMLFLPLATLEYQRYYVFFILISSIVFLTESVLDRQQGLNYFMFFYSLYTIRAFQRSA